MQQQQTGVVSNGQVNSGYDQPVPVVVVQMHYGQPLVRTSNVVASYRHRQSLYLGVTMIVAGALSVVFNIVDLAADTDYVESLGFVGHGFWSGFMCVIAGSFGVAASRTRTAGMIRAFLVLSVIAANFSLAQMGLSIAGALRLDDCTPYQESYYLQIRIQIAMESLLAILSLVGGISAICGSTLGCKAACCCSYCCCEKYPATPADGIIYYTPMTVDTQQQQEQGVPQGFLCIYPGQPHVAGEPPYNIAGPPPYNTPYSYNQPATQQPTEKI